MRAGSSFAFRSTFTVVRTPEPEGMSSQIAQDLQSCVRIPASPILPGETVAAQMRRAWERLDRPKWWRLKAAWYGEAGSFSAAAAFDLQQRFLTWREREARQAASAAETDRLRKEASDRHLLEQSRAECVAALARIESRLALLTGEHP